MGKNLKEKNAQNLMGFVQIIKIFLIKTLLEKN